MINKTLPLSLFIAVVSLTSTSAQSIDYQDFAISLGIDHTFDNNNSGGGVSMVDFDGDGLDDITLSTNINDVIHFYRNTGTSFERVDLNIDLMENTKSVIWVDYDNDGDKDLYVAAFDAPNRLYMNQGSLSMINVTESSNLPVLDSLRTFGAVWGDYDRDGWLDLYYTERINTAGIGPHRNRLFRNMADGTFSEYTNIAMVSDTARLPFCAAFVDMNNDKWPDIYIANDKKKRNTMLQNVAGIYQDVSESSNGGIEMDAMCVAPGDYNNDGKMDIYVSNIDDGGKLLTNTSEDSEAIVIEETAVECQVALEGGIGWGSLFLDVDNDGYEDLYVSGMRISSIGYSSQLFVNDRMSAFYEDDFGFEGDTVRSYNNAIGDIDNDGNMEIMVVNSSEFQSQLWKNNESTGNWLKIKLEGVKSNKDGIGSWVKVFTGEGQQTRYTTCGNSFMGQNTNTLHYGIANYTTIDSVNVIWPTGHVDRLYNINSNEILNIIEGESTAGIINVDEDIQLVSSIAEDNFNSEILIYPNPANDRISISCDRPIKEVRIVDQLGQTVLISESQSIDIKNLRSGVYFVTVSLRDQLFSTQKIIKL